MSGSSSGPAYYWLNKRETRTFDLVEGHRLAGCVVASGDSRAFDDPGVFVEILLANRIRPRVALIAYQHVFVAGKID